MWVFEFSSFRNWLKFGKSVNHAGTVNYRFGFFALIKLTNVSDALLIECAAHPAEVAAFLAAKINYAKVPFTDEVLEMVIKNTANVMVSEHISEIQTRHRRQMETVENVVDGLHAKIDELSSTFTARVIKTEAVVKARIQSSSVLKYSALNHPHKGKLLRRNIEKGLREIRQTSAFDYGDDADDDEADGSLNVGDDMFIDDSCLLEDDMIMSGKDIRRLQAQGEPL